MRSKPDPRESFFRGGGDAPTMTTQNQNTKYDPSIRERQISSAIEKDSIREKDKLNMMPSNSPPPSEGKEKTKEMEGYVGFANLPNQVYRKAVKRGFEFTLMVVGESGLGKSTLINSMFLSDIYSAEHPGPSHRTKKTMNVENTQVVLKEGGVQLRLTVVDTPGFGDAVDNSNCWQPVTEFIESQYDNFLNSESRVNRKVNPDNRVHCCLYFVSPNGHGLKPLDVEFMKRLHDKVNIIPIIAKADTLTVDECREFKKTILNEIAQHKIRIYEFPDCDEEEESKHQKKLKDRVPFAVVGSNTTVESAGRRVRGRIYPWGVVEVENLEHNDFIALRNMLIRTHMQDLKDVTNNVHYENFRYNKLASVTANTKSGNKPGNPSKSPLLQMEEERKEHMSKMKKMEAEMEQVFEMKVKEKKQKLKDSESDLVRRSEQMKKSLEQQKLEIGDKRKKFESDRGQWNEQEEERRRSLENKEKTSTSRLSIFSKNAH